MAHHHHHHRPQSGPATGRRRSISDPLAAALLPPPNETPEQRELRLKAEEDAKKQSDRIDRMIKESERERRRKKVVKVLLLGQSESGKSTTLKQFQLLHAPEAFRYERMAWRFVIYLNLVRSIRRVLEAIAPEPDTHAGLDDAYDDDPNNVASIIIEGSHARSSSTADTGALTYENFLRRLRPLMDLELRLIHLLCDPDDDSQEATHLPLSGYDMCAAYGQQPSSSSAFPAPSTSAPSRPAPRIQIPPGAASMPTSPSSLSPGSELAVSTTSSWKKALSFGRHQSPKSAHSGELQGWWEDPHDPVHVLHHYAPVMSELWRDKWVQQRLKEKRVRLEESSGFYLDQIERVTAKMYFPTDEDVLKARLKTNGVIEHTFTLPKNSEFRGVEWKIYDVGGARSQRQAWAPYFDDVNAIIFLAPISAFDQVLAEDPSVNRLEDSLLLWQYVTSNKLLANVNIVLFLNKCDLLRRKLESGVRLKHYMPSYENRPNDYDTVSNYFRMKFIVLHNQFTPNKSRECFVHLTSVTDTRKTHLIINNVRDIILTGNLKSSALI